MLSTGMPVLTVTHYRELHSAFLILSPAFCVCYLLLCPALCLLLIPEPCTLCITYFWGLHTVCCLLLSPELRKVFAPYPGTLCIMHSRPMHSVCYAILNTANALTPKPCHLCIIFSWALHFVHCTLMCSALCVLLIPEPCILYIINSWNLHSVHCIALDPVTYTWAMQSVCYLPFSINTCRVDNLWNETKLQSDMIWQSIRLEDQGQGSKLNINTVIHHITTLLHFH